MVTLKQLRKLRTAASSLVEVLVALVILLTVFAMGMLIFTRLMQANRSQTSQQAQLQLAQLKARYMQGSWNDEAMPATGPIQYSLEEESLPSYSDRLRIKLYAYDSEQQLLIDSLIFISPNDEQE